MHIAALSLLVGPAPARQHCLSMIAHYGPSSTTAVFVLVVSLSLATLRASAAVAAGGPQILTRIVLLTLACCQAAALAVWSGPYLTTFLWD